MSPGGEENQLELFDLAQPCGPPRRRETLGRVFLQLRHDQLVIVAMFGLLGLTVIFAVGVERGKELARAERPVLERQRSAAAPSTMPQAPEPPARIAPSSRPAADEKSAPAAAPKAKQPSKPPARRSRYAVQVVTYSRSQLAKLELQRLQARGESAFLVMREGRTSVYVGPFLSKANASQKLAMLKPRYQDCFVKGL